ncbi:hypothetical protein [Paenibacillus piri]|uniref:hypothetical protein n=1 Tax=Paenibacillus piri TaxID=2547395 RepID=UPI00140460AE|nr:hypothetical protein [Paenibacillus piri]
MTMGTDFRYGPVARPTERTDRAGRTTGIGNKRPRPGSMPGWGRLFELYIM